MTEQHAWVVRRGLSYLSERFDHRSWTPYLRMARMWTLKGGAEAAAMTQGGTAIPIQLKELE